MGQRRIANASLTEAFLPFITVVGIALADFIGGAVVTEAVLDKPLLPGLQTGTDRACAAVRGVGARARLALLWQNASGSEGEAAAALRTSAAV